MTDKHLQTLTASVSDIGQASVLRRSLPTRRHHITQKIKIAGQRALYISVHDDEHPAEIFLRLKGANCSSGLIGLNDVIARLLSLALQYGATPEKVENLFAEAQFAPWGPVYGHNPLKQCLHLLELIGRHLLVAYCGRRELGHFSITAQEGSS
jgi:hypothetical protein